MEKDSKGGDSAEKKGSRDATSPSVGSIDPSLFAHSIFGGGGAAGGASAAAASGFNPLMMSGFPMMGSSPAAALASMAAGSPALGGMSQANAAWMNLMHQLATQDYLNRLHSGAAAGIHPLAGMGYEALAGMKAAAALANVGGSTSKDGQHSSYHLPDGTEIVKQTSSMSGPKVPGTTNRGRKKTISLDPPFYPGPAGDGSLSHGVSSILARSVAETRLTDSVTITPTAGPKSTTDRLRELEMLGTKVAAHSVGSSSAAQVTITPVSGKGTTMLTSSVSLTPVERGRAAVSSPPPTGDAPLNLSKKTPSKSRGSTGSSLSPSAASSSTAALAAAAAAQAAADSLGYPSAAMGFPLTPEQQLEQFRNAMASAVMAQKAMTDYRSQQLGSGRGRSKKHAGSSGSRTKKNTVASLLATTRNADDAQPTGGNSVKMSTNELTIEVRPRSSTAPSTVSSAGDDDDCMSVQSSGSDKKHRLNNTSNADDPNNSFPYSSYLARLKREYEDSSGLDSEEVSESEGDTPSGRAGGASQGSMAPPSKKRKVVTDEEKLRKPLDRGWRRETTIRKLTQAGPRGDVVYYAPCGKAFRQFPDILRYLERNGITDVTRDHFTFSSKVIIGDYLKISEDGEECIPISETEVKRQVDILSGGKKKLFKKPYVINIKSDERAAAGRSPSNAGTSSSTAAAAAASSSFHQAMEMMRRLEEERKVRQLKEEQKRKEKELRNAQLLEERRKKQEELERQRAAENLRKTQELNKQRELLYILELERERRRHHMLLVKALDARRRHEERDRRREDMKMEKAALRDRQMKKRLLDAESNRFQKRPVEDMQIKDLKTLPEFPRVPGLFLAGEAFANCLLVFEFLHNFGETLGFDMDSLPTLSALQLGLLNDAGHEDELMSVLAHLVVCAVEDPGVPHPVRHVTLLNQTLRQADITHSALSEVIRIYLLAVATSEVKNLTGLSLNARDPCKIKNADYYVAINDNRTHRMATWLQDRPFLALNPTEKSDIMAHLCNDLLQNKTVLRQIDTAVEAVNSRRKEKSALELRLRRLKILRGKKRSQRATPMMARLPSEGDPTGRLNESVKKEDADETKEDEEDEDKEESGNESEAGDESIIHDDADVSAMSGEDLQKYIDQLSERNDKLGREIFESTQTVRPTSLGQDRYRRNYWVLPRAGGVYLEAVESGATCGDSPLVSCPSTPLVNGDSASVEAVKPVVGDAAPTEAVKPAIGDAVDASKPPVKTEPMEVDGALKSEQERLPAGHQPCIDAATTAVTVKSEPSVDGDQKPDASRLKSEDIKPAAEDGEPKKKSQSQPPPALFDKKQLVRFLAATLPSLGLNNGSGSLCCDTTANGTAVELPGLGRVSTQLLLQAVKLSEATAGAGWFSLLPREPCDFGTITELSDDDDEPAAGEDSRQLQLPADQSPVVRPTEIKLELDDNVHQLPQPTPQEYLNGWWRMTDKTQVDRLCASLHTRGVRERMLKSKLYTLGSTVGESCQLGDPEEVSLAPIVADDDDSASGTSDCGDSPAASIGTPTSERIGDNGGTVVTSNGASPPLADLVSEDAPQKPSPESEPDAVSSPAAADGAEPMETDGNQLPAAAAVPDSPAVDGCPSVPEAAVLVNGESTSPLTNGEDAHAGGGEAVVAVRPQLPEMRHGAPVPDTPRHYRSDVALNAEMYLLEQVENLEERIAQASMQVKTWRLPTRVSGDRHLFAASCRPQPGLLDPVSVARDRLRDLDLNIERRYLKPPLGTSKGADLSLSNLGSEENNTVPRQLTVWRDALPRATNVAQISMCLYMLETSIAWDKSIMKANCQFCTSGDHEEKLLLCDGCDKGYHTYCFKPAMDNIPDGDWYCYECVNKATGERACVVCGKGEGKVLFCEGCPRSYHPDCLKPPVAKVPRGKWNCPACAHKSPKKARPKKAKTSIEPLENSISDEKTATVEKEVASPPKKERQNKKLAKELASCRVLLSDLEGHEDSWPFLLPVNTKQFPTYKKIIKSPMDLSTIKKRLLDGTYKTKEDFLADIRVIFDNCVTFNEDDSPVGKAGHNMRQFFELRWQELYPL